MIQEKKTAFFASHPRLTSKNIIVLFIVLLALPIAVGAVQIEQTYFQHASGIQSQMSQEMVLAATIKNDNNQLILLANQNKSMQTSGSVGSTSAQVSLLSRMVTLSKSRKAAMLSLIQTSPSLALGNVMPDVLRAQMPFDVQQNIEQQISDKGTVYEFHADDFAGHKDIETHHFVASNGKEYALFFSDQAPQILSTAQVTLSGMRLDTAIALSNKNLHSFTQGSANENPLSTQTASPKRVVVVPLQFKNTPQTQAKDAITKKFFGEMTSRDPADKYSVNSFFEDSSYDYSKKTSNMGLSGQVVDWVQLTNSANDKGECSYKDWMNQAKQKINLDGYQMVVFALNVNPKCTDQGTSEFGGISIKPNIVFVKGLDDPNFSQDNSHFVQYSIHEIGHLLGLGHGSSLTCYDSHHHQVPISDSCSIGDEYGDPFDAMSNPNTSSIAQFNAYHKHQAGFGAGTQVITKNGTYTIDPLESNMGTSMLRIPIDHSGKSYFVDFRQPMGVFDKSLQYGPIIFAGVVIRVAPVQSSSGFWNTALVNPHVQTRKDYLFSPLNEGETFYDSYHKIGIYVSKIAKYSGDFAHGFAEVKVSFGHPPTGTTPTPTPRPGNDCTRAGFTCSASNKSCGSAKTEVNFTCDIHHRQACCAPIKNYGSCGTGNKGVCTNNDYVAPGKYIESKEKIPQDASCARIAAKNGARNKDVFCCSGFPSRGHIWGSCSNGDVCTDDPRCRPQESGVSKTPSTSCGVKAMAKGVPAGETVYCIMPKSKPTPTPTPKPRKSTCPSGDSCVPLGVCRANGGSVESKYVCSSTSSVCCSF